MFSFLDYKNVIRNMAKLASNIEGVDAMRHNLRDSYLRSLNMIQEHKFNFNPNSDEVLLDFDVSNPVTESTLRYFMSSADCVAHCGGPPSSLKECSYSEAEIKLIKDNTNSAFSILHKYNPNILKIMILLNGSFIFAKQKNHAASSHSNTLGTIWISPPQYWQPIDFAESILHETTHQALFLDDMINKVFTQPPKELANETALITSAIRKNKRPYDLSFHSACVSIGLVDLYTNLNYLEKAEHYFMPLLATIRELKTKESYLTDHGKNILNELEDMAASHLQKIKTI